MTLGESARKARKDAGMTQNKLSEISGVGASTIFSIESADRNPAVLTVEALAMALGISMEQYIGSEIDCVHVVRCKDCKGRELWIKTTNGVDVCRKSGMFPRGENDFCSYGERKPDET